ncbi:MAG: hypothetical protein EOP86_28280 [Verrucomicrobiaceae bacterium]|nr:MAG: hypothetical protein EOP86_28280 [Verrucomicrobiaceae bacterium]
MDLLISAMGTRVHIVEDIRTREVDCPEPLNIISFIGKFHVRLHDVIRTAHDIEIITKDSSSVFRIKLLGTLPRESLPMVVPGSVVLVGERTSEERDAAKAWIRRNQASSNVDSAARTSPDGPGIKAVGTPRLPMASSVENHSMSHWYAVGFIPFLILFGALYFKKWRKRLSGS